MFESREGREGKDYSDFDDATRMNMMYVMQNQQNMYTQALNTPGQFNQNIPMKIKSENYPTKIGGPMMSPAVPQRLYMVIKPENVMIDNTFPHTQVNSPANNNTIDRRSNSGNGGDSELRKVI